MVRGKPAGLPTAKRQTGPGRPSAYSEELAAAICDRLINGESLVRICKSEGMPDRSTVLRWQASLPEFAAKCARARDGQADFLHDDMAEIEDKVADGTMDPAAARVILSSKQWRASKLAPKKYGDRTQLEHTGAGGGPIQTVDLSSLTEEQLAALEPVLAALASGSDGASGAGQG